MNDFDGLVAVVTGGASGIGAAPGSAARRTLPSSTPVRLWPSSASANVRSTAPARKRQPLGRLVSPDEVASAIAYLASPLAASTTGTVLAVHGGMVNVRL